MSATDLRLRRASVLGAGQIGGSIWRRLVELGMDVVGWDPDTHVRALAREMRLKCAEDRDDAIADAEVIFLAGPLSALPELLAKISHRVSAQCIITDVGSTKSEVVNAADRLRCDQFIGGHPMAGTEGSGLAASNPSLFGGAAWVLTVERAQQLPQFRKLACLLLAGFDARIVPLNAKRHDQIVAMSSHLPHILAGGLANCVADSPLKNSILGLAAGSFRDGTRVAGTLPERTADMLWNNREFLVEALNSCTQALAEFTNATESRKQLEQLFEKSFALRDEFLNRDMRQTRRKFSVNSEDNYRELQFLSDVGVSGGHIAEFDITDEVAAYTAWLPSF